MKKSLCFLVIDSIAFCLVQAAEFKLTGRTTWQLAS
jgi:hypothetical protein